jgi:hypothetical protein
MSTFEGKFADYLAEGDATYPIELPELGITLPVPTRKQITAYYEIQESDRPAKERGEESWKILLGKHHTKVMKYFDDRPVNEWNAFSRFVSIEWFGRGADEVEGK